MIETRLSVGTNLHEFRCPQCQLLDVAYAQMPAWCYSCEYEYNYDARALFQILEARVDHYQRGITLFFEEY